MSRDPRKSRRSKFGSEFSFMVLEPRQMLNATPFAQPDLLYTTPVNTTLSISLTSAGVTANDFDLEAGTLMASKVEDTTNGTLTLNSNGTFTYVPNTGFEGVDTFTYTVSDGSNTSLEATGQILVGTGLTGSLKGPEQSSNLLHDGVLSLSQSLGSGPSLSYRSDTIPTVIVPVETMLAPGTTIPDSITAELTIGGVSSGAIEFSNSGLATGEPFRFALRADADSLATGMYDWTITADLNYSGTAVSRTFSGQEAIVNRTDSEYGSGWWVDGLDRIYDQSNGALLVRGDGTTLWFEKVSGVYEAADGDKSYSVLTKNGGGDFTLTDKFGNVERFDSSGYVTDFQYVNNSVATWTYSYDAQNRLDKITDEFGRTTTFNYTNGKLSSVADFYGRTTNATVSSGDLTSVTVADETVVGYTAPTWNYQYTSVGGESLLNKVVEPSSEIIEYAFDSETRRLTQIYNQDHTAGSPSAFQLFPTITQGIATQNGQAVISVANMDARYINEEGHTFGFATDRFGNITSLTSPGGATASFEFSHSGLLYRLTEADPDAAGPLASPVTQFGYSTNGNLVKTILPDGETTSTTYHSTLNLPLSATNELGKTESFGYDSVGNLTSSTDVDGNVWTFTYDSHGNLLTRTTPDADGFGSLYTATTTTYSYDATYYNRLTRTTWGDGSFSDFTYTASDRIATFTDQAGNVTSYQYDPLDRLTQKTLPDPDGAGSQASPVYQYAYGSNLALASETDPLGNSTTYHYNARNWLEKITLPDPDGSGSLAAPEYIYGYDKLGNRTSEVRPEFDGVSITYTYDADGQQTSITGPVSGQQTTYTYDDLGRLTTSVDPTGRTINFEYDVMGRLLKLIDHDPDGVGPSTGPTTQFTYDAAGRLTSETDPLGNTTSYAYYDNGLTQSITQSDPDGNGPAAAPVTSYQYDALGRLATTTTPSGRTTSSEYDIFGQVTKYIGVDPDASIGPLTAPETLYTYDSVGRLATVTNTLGHVTSHAYDNLGRLLSTTLPDPDGAGGSASPVNTYTYDAAGNLSTATDPLGNTTTITYDNLYRRTSLTLADPDGVGPESAPVWSYQYNDQGLLSSTTNPLSQTASNSYDTAGRLITSTNIVGSTTSYAYDVANRLTSTTAPDPDGAGPLVAAVTTTNYDIYSRVSSVVDAAGGQTTYTYSVTDQLLSLTDASGNTTRWAYDDLGRMAMEADQNEGIRSFNYNIVDRMVRRTDRNGRVIRYVNFGHETTELWKEHLTNRPEALTETVTNGSSGTNEVQKITLSNLSAGGSGGGPGGPGGGGTGGGSSDYFRIAFGGQVAAPLEADATASDVETALEALDSIDNVQVSKSGDVFTITFLGDQAGQDVAQLMTDVIAADDGTLVHEILTETDAIDRTIAVEDDFADFAYSYDDIGRIVNATENITGLTPSISMDYSYDLSGNRTSSAVTLGSNKDYYNSFSFDALNRLKTIEQYDQTGGNTVADKRVDYQHNALGQTTAVDRFTSLSSTNPSLRTVYQYDTGSRLTSLQHLDVDGSGNTTLLAGYTYTHDAVNRITSINSTTDGVSDYTFDILNQLTNADHASGRVDETYNFDATGNRDGSGYAVGDDNLTTSDGVYDYTYDAEGNRTRRTEIASGDYEEFTWDHRNRLTSVNGFDSLGSQTSSIEYTYDAFNRMVKRSYDSDGPFGNAATDQYFAGFDGIHATLEFDGSSENDLTHRFLWNGNQLIAQEDVTALNTAGEVLWPLGDHVGTLRDIAQWDGATSSFDVVNHRVYDTYGKLTSQTNSGVELDYGYTAQWTDEVTRLTHNHHRWYDPNIGKWLSDDPLGFAAGDANVQRYVGNQPTAFTDPSGLIAQGVNAIQELEQDASQGTEKQTKKGTQEKNDQASDDPIIIVISGFKPFKGRTANASEDIAKRIVAELKQPNVELKIIDVEWDKPATVVGSTVKDRQIELWIGIGESSKPRTIITYETKATNKRDITETDERNRKPGDQGVDATNNRDEKSERTRALEVPKDFVKTIKKPFDKEPKGTVKRSSDAGQFICDALCWEAGVDYKPSINNFAFIHIPVGLGLNDPNNDEKRDDFLVTGIVNYINEKYPVPKKKTGK